MKIRYFALICGLLFGGCWEKQNNEIMRPDIPSYSLQVTVKDIDFKSPADSILVQLSPIMLSETDDYSSHEAWTDYHGEVLFDSVYVGSYYLHFFKNDVLLRTYGYFQKYADSSMTAFVPGIFEISENQRLDFIPVLKNYHPNYFSFSQNSWYSLLFAGDSIFRFKWDTNQSQWTQLQAFKNIININNLSSGAIQLGQNSYDFYMTVRPDSLYKIHILPASLVIEKAIKMDFFVRDVYYYAGRLYVAGIDQVHVYNESDLSPIETFNINQDDFYIQTLYIDQNYIWIFEEYKKWLYQCDLGLNVLRTYQPVIGTLPCVIADASKDYNGKLWYLLK